MAHIIQRLRGGDSIDDAIRSMKKHFFDYHQLAPFEKQWAKQAFPFYSWSRKNIPYQLEMLVRRPDRIARFHGTLQAWESSEETPPEERYINSWMKRNFSVRVRRNTRGEDEYFAFRNWLPLVDISEIFHGLEWMTQNMTPWVRVPIEQLANENFFTDRNIDHLNNLLMGERTRYLTGKGIPGFKGWRGVGVPNRVSHILKSIRLSNTLHQLLDNPQELSFTAQLGRLLAGRVYPLDVGRSQWQFIKDLEAMELSTRKAMRSAMHAGDSPAIGRLLEQHLKQRKKYFAERGIDAG